MRTCQQSVLALLLLGTASAWGQAPLPVATPEPSPTPVSQTSQAMPPQFDLGFGDEIQQPARARSDLFWLRTDYLIWTITKEPTPSILAFVPDQYATQTGPGVVGNNVFPTNYELEYKNFSGARVNTGFWFGPGHDLGLDFSGFILQNKTLAGYYPSGGSPIVSRVFQNIGNNTPTYLYFSSPDPAGPYSGAVAAQAQVSNLYNADASLRWNGIRIFSDNTDYLYGVRYMKFDESLKIQGRANLPGPDGRILLVQDSYQVKNTFYGAQFGIDSRWVGYHGFTLDAVLKLAMGGVHQQVDIRGFNGFLNPDGSTDVQRTGLWATSANIGKHNRGKFAVLPELDLNIGYNITDRLAITFGYSAMIISNVMRVSRAVQPGANGAGLRYVQDLGNNAPNPNPIFRFDDTAMWLYGFNFGVRWEF